MFRVSFTVVCVVAAAGLAVGLPPGIRTLPALLPNSSAVDQAVVVEKDCSNFTLEAWLAQLPAPVYMDQLAPAEAPEAVEAEPVEGEQTEAEAADAETEAEAGEAQALRRRRRRDVSEEDDDDSIEDEDNKLSGGSGGSGGAGGAGEAEDAEDYIPVGPDGLAAPGLVSAAEFGGVLPAETAAAAGHPVTKLQLSRVEAAVETAAAAGQPVSNLPLSAIEAAGETAAAAGGKSAASAGDSVSKLQLRPTILESGTVRPSEEITVKLDNFGSTPMEYFVTITEHEAEQGGSLCSTGHFAPEAQMEKMEYNYHQHAGTEGTTELAGVGATELPGLEATDVPKVGGLEGLEVGGTRESGIGATELPGLQTTEAPEGTEAPEQEHYTAVQLGAPAAGAATTCATVVTGSVEGSAAVSANFTAGACGCYVVRAYVSFPAANGTLVLTSEAHPEYLEQLFCVEPTTIAAEEEAAANEEAADMEHEVEPEAEAEAEAEV